MPVSGIAKVTVSHHASLRRGDHRLARFGRGYRVGVMSLLGANSIKAERPEQEKLERLRSLPSPPDIIADLSLKRLNIPIWVRAREYGFATSALPVYTVRRRDGRIDEGELLARCQEQIGAGISMLTIHPTPTRELVALSARRRVPCTSRGGGLVIRDLMLGDGADNVYMRILPELTRAARDAGVVLSLGATFRSANIFDSNDEAQRREIASQIDLANELRASGCSVVIESPGHARPRDIESISDVLATSGYPIMPLGPIPTDAAAGQDHVSSAIGATLLGLRGAAHILAAVTREEHTGGVPSVSSIVEAAEAARVAAHIIDLHTLDDVANDEAAVSWRSGHRTCVVGQAQSGCNRCAATCPLPTSWAERSISTLQF